LVIVDLAWIDEVWVDGLAIGGKVSMMQTANQDNAAATGCRGASDTNCGCSDLVRRFAPSVPASKPTNDRESPRRSVDEPETTGVRADLAVRSSGSNDEISPST
jgi:hypothetical protein